jgi:hypothetical protein
MEKAEGSDGICPQNQAYAGVKGRIVEVSCDYDLAMVGSAVAGKKAVYGLA